MDPLNNPAFVAFAAFSPLLVSLLKQQGFTRQVNALIALACYVAVGVVGVLVSGAPLTLEHATALVTLATVIGSAAYNLVWNTLGTGEDGQGPSLDDRLTARTSLIR